MGVKESPESPESERAKPIFTREARRRGEKPKLKTDLLLYQIHTFGFTCFALIRGKNSDPRSSAKIRGKRLRHAKIKV